MNISDMTNSIKGKDWFHSIDQSSDGTIIVYAKYMSGDILTSVPDVIDRHRVLLHFASSKTVRKDQFVSDGKPSVVLAAPATAKVEELSSDLLERDITDLIFALDRLERVCGSHTLQDIFYEVHDGENAVTNLSARYPDVRKALEALYDEFGFDIIYEELDG